jgi:hypothetical protein
LPRAAGEKGLQDPHAVLWQLTGSPPNVKVDCAFVSLSRKIFARRFLAPSEGKNSPRARLMGNDSKEVSALAGFQFGVQRGKKIRLTILWSM